MLKYGHRVKCINTYKDTVSAAEYNIRKRRKKKKKTRKLENVSSPNNVPEEFPCISDIELYVPVFEGQF